MSPLQRGAALFPAAALRSDPGLLLTAARFFGPELLSLAFVANQLTVSRACSRLTLFCCLLPLLLTVSKGLQQIGFGFAAC